MSKKVTRYDLRVTNDGAGLYATDEPNTRGMQYVSALDYDALLAEREELNKDAQRYRLFAETTVAEFRGSKKTVKQSILFEALNSIEELSSIEELNAIVDHAFNA